MWPEEVDHWLNRIQIYKQEEWSAKPSLFALFTAQYLPERGRLLELGSGSGQDSVWFAGKGLEVTQTDVVATGFEHAKELARQQKVTISQVVVNLWEPLEFSDSSFDVVYAQLSLHYFNHEHTQKVFGEIFRVLKPGGILAALLNAKTDPEYGTGKEIEPDYYQVGKLRKRYFSTESVQEFLTAFDTELLDDKGETYKDQAKGVHNLIRLIAKKPH